MRLKQTSYVLLAVLAFAGVCLADSQARIVRLSYLEGDVQLDRNDGNGYARAFLNMPLIEGSMLWAKEDGRAEVEFEDGSTLRLAPGAIVRFGELRLRNDGSKATSVELRDGTVYFDLRQHDDDSFRVNVGAREITLKKSSEFRLIHVLEEDSDLRVAVFKGELRFLDRNGQFITIKKNETLSLEFDDSGRYFLAKGITEEPHDYWNKERDHDREVLAARDRDSVYASDLSRYGSYFTVAGYGQVWRPFSVGFGWDPFAFGSWVYYPGLGHIWVSDYIWGWAPYRYGSWINVSGYGWCWRPQLPHGGWWNPRPVIVNAPSGYVAPVVPPSNPRTPIIRVGRNLDPLDRPGDRRRDDFDAPIGVVQDRIRGVRQADGHMPPSRRIAPPPGSDGRPVDTIGDRRVWDDSNRDRPGDRRGEIRRPEPRGVDETKRTRDLGIDAHRESDQPTRVTPRPASPPAAPVQPVIQDRPVRTPRSETPVAPAPRIDRPAAPPPSRAPSNPAPRLNTPPPSPPPQPRSAPVRDGVKDQ